MKVSRLPVLLALICMSSALSQAPLDEIRSRIKRQPVVSTNVTSVGYSRPLHALEIEFSRGAIYRFLDVQPRVYRDLMASQSKGHFIAQNIRGKYRFVRVRPSRAQVVHGRARLTTNEQSIAAASPAP
jgi:hypothetical protein